MSDRSGPKPRWWRVMAVAAAAAWGCAGGAAPSSPRPVATPSGPAGVADLVIRDVRVFDGDRVLEGATVVVRDGRIESVQPGAAAVQAREAVDGAGRTLLPGLIDGHTHTFTQTALTAALAFGVTTVLDQFSAPEVVRPWKAEQESGPVPGRADLFSAGILATAAGGHGTQYGFPIPTVDDPGDADAWVAERLAEGSDWIKLVIEDGSSYGRTIPTLDGPRVAAVVAAAHRHGLKAWAHVARLSSARMAAEAGADGLVHVWSDRMPDPALVRAMADAGMYVVPTLAVTESLGARAGGSVMVDDPRVGPYLDAEAVRSLETTFPSGPGLLSSSDSARESVRALRAGGVGIVAGTDAPNPGTAHGASMHHELVLLVEAGLTPVEALAAGTSVAADAFELADRGRIRPGLRADLVLVDGDPTRDIARTRSIAAVWKAGQRFDREAYGARIAAERTAAERAAAAPGRGPGPISDFDDGSLAVAFGAGWSETTDRMVGGTSVVNLEVVEDAGRTALRITGETKAGVPYPWSGVMFSPAEQPMGAANLSGSTGLAFLTRGDGGTYQVLLFHEQGGMVPVTVDFTAGTEWSEVVIPWARFDGADGRGVMGIAIVAGSTPRVFEVLVDSVELR